MRRRWMALAAVSALGSVLVLIFASPHALSVRQSGQIQFMHAMATFSCATFMNIGGQTARYAPYFFIAGTILYCGSAYMAAAMTLVIPDVIPLLGIVALSFGWATLILATLTIDSQPFGQEQSDDGVDHHPSV